MEMSWRREELLALLQAWEQAVPAPRDRDRLLDAERARLQARFEALCPRDTPADRRQAANVERQRQRLVKTFLFIRAFNAESARAGRPLWFQLSLPQQDSLRRINDRYGGMTFVDEIVFQELTRICESPVVPPAPQQQPYAAQEASQPRYYPPTQGGRPAADEMTAAAEALAGLPMFRPQAATQSQSQPSSPSPSPAWSPVQPSKLPPLPLVMPQTQYSDSGFESESRSESELESRSESESESGSRSGSGSKGPTASTGWRGEDDGVSEEEKAPVSKSRPNAPPKWTKRDEMRLVTAWHEVVTDMAASDSRGALASRAEALKFNALVHERYVALCDGVARTNQSTGAKKHAILSAFRFLRSLLRTLASSSGDKPKPNWFAMSVEERIELQKEHGFHQEYACTIELDMYSKLAEIDASMKAILAPGAGRHRPTAATSRTLRQLRSSSRTKVVPGGASSDKKSSEKKPSDKKVADKKKSAIKKPAAKKPIDKKVDAKQFGAKQATKKTLGLPGGFMVPSSSSSESEADNESEAESTTGKRGGEASPLHNRLSVATPSSELRFPQTAGQENSKRSVNAPSASPILAAGATKTTAKPRLKNARNTETDSSSPKRRRTGLSDAGWVSRLLDAQTQRFEELLAEFREERRQERQHNVEIVMEALKLRAQHTEKAGEPTPFVESLVEKQRQHLLDIFYQLQDERTQEREQARALLRELHSSNGPLRAGAGGGLDEEQKE